MFTHLSLLLVILLAGMIWERKTLTIKIQALRSDDFYDCVTPLAPWVFFFGYLSLLAGMRSGMNDTSLYIYSFINAPTSWSSFINSLGGDIRYVGTNALEILFKILISNNYHAWFLMWAVIESCLFINVLRRESVSYLDSCFYFFASHLYFNYFSMMRQWMAVAIFFWGSRYLRDGKFVKYVIICLVAAVFHTSAVFMIPLFFIVRGKRLGGKQSVLIVLFTILIIFLRPILNTLDTITEGSIYDYVVETMRNGKGASVVRVFIEAVPIILLFIGRNKDSTPMIDICVNMSFLNILLNILAVFTSGLYVIRMSTFISVFNCILFPYLLNITCEKQKGIKLLYYIAYFIFFIYQATYGGTWGYRSDVLQFLSNY